MQNKTFTIASSNESKHGAIWNIHNNSGVFVLLHNNFNFLLNMKAFTNGNIILGSEYAHDIRHNVKVQAEALQRRKIMPCLVVILVGENPASKIYVANKKKFAIE